MNLSKCAVVIIHSCRTYACIIEKDARIVFRKLIITIIAGAREKKDPIEFPGSSSDADEQKIDQGTRNEP